MKELEYLIKEIQSIKETTMWINKYTEATKELNNYYQFFIEYLEIIPESEISRFLMLMNEFGIAKRNEQKT